MPKVLVTGAAGFIGSHTCWSLIENGYEKYDTSSLIKLLKKNINE